MIELAAADDGALQPLRRHGEIIGEEARRDNSIVRRWLGGAGAMRGERSGPEQSDAAREREQPQIGRRSGERLLPVRIDGGAIKSRSPARRRRPPPRRAGRY